MTDLKPGDRVHIEGNWNWPDDCVGVVAIPPAFVMSLDRKHPWQGHLHTVPGRTGPITFVWINFEKAQHDGDGDGPYRGGEVELDYVTRRDEPRR